MSTNERAGRGGADAPPASLKPIASDSWSATTNDRLADLPETARRILSAALDLLSSEGYSAMTLQRVADLAGVNKSTVIYTFGNKAGLVSAVVDAQVHDINVKLTEAAAQNPSDRLHGAIEGMGALVEATAHLGGYFDILPHAFRHPDLRERLWRLYGEYFDQYLEWFGLSRAGSSSDEDGVLYGLAQLIVAIPDGLAIQAELGREEFDVHRPLAAFEFLLRNAMNELQRIMTERDERS